MKNFRFLLLLAIVPFMMVSCKKAEPNLRAILNLQGPVETCQCECANVTFDESASTISFDQLYGETTWYTDIEHRQIVLTNGASEEAEHTVTFSYDKEGRLEEVVEVNNASKSEIVTKYKYNKNELLPKSKTVKGGAEGKQKGEITYGEVDIFGNWTVATWNGTTYTRTLTYFPVAEGAEIVSNCPTDVTLDKDLFWEIVISLLILAAALVMIVHMLLTLFKGKVRQDWTVADFVAKRAEAGRPAAADEAEIARAMALIQDTYSEWQTIHVDGEELVIPGKGSVVRKSYAAIKEIEAIAPTDEETVGALNAFAEALNACMSRKFTGSWPFIIMATIVAVIFAFLAPGTLAFFGSGVVLYFLASRKAEWMICKEYTKGGNKTNFMSGILGMLLGGVAAAQTVRTVTKWSDGTTTTNDDHSQHWIALFLLGCWFCRNFNHCYPRSFN